jgi:hypothetical protein
MTAGLTHSDRVLLGLAFGIRDEADEQDNPANQHRPDNPPDPAEAAASFLDRLVDNLCGDISAMASWAFHNISPFQSFFLKLSLVIRGLSTG